LIAALGYEFNEQRGPAAKALVRIGTAAVEPLIAALKDKNGTISAAVAQMLGDIGDTRAIEPLLGALRDGKKAVRQSAARALGQVEDPRAVEPLIAALADPEESVGEAAAKALEALSVPRGLEAVQQWRETAQKAQPARPKPDAHASRCGEKIGIVHILSANNPYADVVGIASNVDAEVMRRFGELLDIPMCKISVSPNEGKIVFAYTTLEIEPAGGAQLQQAISEIAERYNQ